MFSSFDKKYYETDSLVNGQNVLRQLGECKKRRTVLQQRRAHMLVEGYSVENVDNSATCTLVVEGYTRGGRRINVDHAVHLPGIGDFLLSHIDVAVNDPHAMKKSETTEVCKR
jgi:hypothetical protein